MNVVAAEPAIKPTSGYLIEIVPDARRALAVWWLRLSIVALFVAGIFSVLLVLARTPAIGEALPGVDFFHTALVIHVDLSVLVWNLAFAGVLWSLAARPASVLVGQAACTMVALAALILTGSALLPDAAPLMSNYVPVLDHAVFLFGLVLFAAGMCVLVLNAMHFIPPVGREVSAGGVVRFGLNCAAISVLVAAGAFAWSWAEIPGSVAGAGYYELLFWGGGHVLQYTYTLLMMVCWLWLSSVAGIRQFMSERVMLILFLLCLASVFVSPVIYYAWDVTDPMHRQMFTWLMSFGGSLATLPLGLAIYAGLLLRRADGERERCAHSALMSSLLLFGAGGVIGFMIRGSDVTIPAHYHGCIVGVTLALMGVGYDLMPRLGYTGVNFRLAHIQLWTYAAGQFMHILGLVWSGGYGVARKVAGAAQDLDSVGQVAGMGLMGLGGLVSAIGGFLFILVAWRALRDPLKTGDTAV